MCCNTSVCAVLEQHCSPHGPEGAKVDGWQEMIFFVKFSSSTAFSIWQPKNARQTLGDKLVCI